MAKEPIIDPWGSVLVEDYEKIVKDFGLEVVDPSIFPNPSRMLRRGVLFAGRDLQVIAKAIKEKKRFYVLTGLMPSGEKIHFGNKMVVESVKYFQDNGADTYLLVADLEAAATRGVSLEEAQKRALDFHIPAYIALGLDPKKTTFYFQSQNMDVVHLAFEFAKRITLSEFKAIYGAADPGRIMSALTQAGDILYPQLGERMPGIIPVGIDQDPHIRLTRDIARRTKQKYKFFLPADIITKYTPSLDGEIKMSKSRPMGNIDLPEDMKSVKKKVMSAFTGGRDTVEEQKKKGGQPEKCMIFEMYKQHLIEDDKKLQKIYDDCKAGKLLCGEDKKKCYELMEKFMKDFEAKVQKARKGVDKLKFIKFK
jgi:tryptophanyl-tRNA synthetase